MNDKEYCIVLTTFSSIEEAKVLIEILLENQLAACVQCFPIQSFYTWKGKVENEKEIEILIKTKSDMYKDVEEVIKANHSYETPEIIKIPITNGLHDYLEWIDDNVKPKKTM